MSFCPHHPGVEMKFHPKMEPIPDKRGHGSTGRQRGRTSQGEESLQAEIIRNRKGILRCSVLGCYRVEDVPEEVFVKTWKCPKCKQPAEMRGDKKDPCCGPCLAIRKKKRLAKNEKDRKRRAKLGEAFLRDQAIQSV